MTACHREAVRLPISMTQGRFTHRNNNRKARSLSAAGFSVICRSFHQDRVQFGAFGDRRNHLFVDVLNFESLTADCGARAGVALVAAGRAAVLGIVAAA